MGDKILPVLEYLPENYNILDFRGHNYKNLRSLKPEDVDESRFAELNGREFLRGLMDVDPSIAECEDEDKLVGKLSRLVDKADMTVDCGMGTREEINLQCAIRDNISQIMRYFKEKHSLKN